ncbi:hypothetical protein C2U53_10860 [Citrobacter sp. CFNIH10]|nr:hypothetical protein C2U53_10860 [Citrobacter sp. CFNIH10]PNP33777.1 hypothetical protein AL525_007830 [Citrobacter amalonaticus]RSC57404.1 hypothetical protein EGW07_07020 [Citrobacter amalonaticus]
MMSKACQKGIQTLKNKKRLAITRGNIWRAYAGWRLTPYPAYKSLRSVGRVSVAPSGAEKNQYSFFAQSSQSPLNGRFMFSIASMMSW